MDARQNYSTEEDLQFATRLAMIRTRFIVKFAVKLQETDAALPRMIGGGAGAADAVAMAYYWFHEVAGLGANVGFAATGSLAKSCETIVTESFRAQCGLSADGLAQLTTGLKSLRIAALTETNSTHSNLGPAS